MPSSHSDDQAFQTLFRAFAEAWNSHDAPAYARLFTEDADFVNVVGMRAQGCTEIEAFHQPIFATMFAQSTITFTSIRIRYLRADIAAVDAEWEMIDAKDPAGNLVPYRRGLANAVTTKQDGMWRFAVFHNQDLPSAAPQATTSSPYATMTHPAANQ